MIIDGRSDTISSRGGYTIVHGGVQINFLKLSEGSADANCHIEIDCFLHALGLV